MLIGVTGKAGAGKDTVANYLVEKHGFKRYAFADAVRDIALAIDPIAIPSFGSGFARLSEIVNAFGWDKAKRDVPEVRRLLQVIGTEAGRQLLGENVWVDIVERKWREDGCPDAVVTDMRFPNEFEWVTNLGEGFTLKIVRPDNPDAIQTSHASEAYDFDCNFVAMNDGPLEELYSGLDALVEFLASPKDPVWEYINHNL